MGRRHQPHDRHRGVTGTRRGRGARRNLSSLRRRATSEPELSGSAERDRLVAGWQIPRKPATIGQNTSSCSRRGLTAPPQEVSLESPRTATPRVGLEDRLSDTNLPRLGSTSKRGKANRRQDLDGAAADARSGMVGFRWIAYASRLKSRTPSTSQTWTRRNEAGRKRSYLTQWRHWMPTGSICGSCVGRFRFAIAWLGMTSRREENFGLYLALGEDGWEMMKMPASEPAQVGTSLDLHGATETGPAADSNRAIRSCGVARRGRPSGRSISTARQASSRLTAFRNASRNCDPVLPMHFTLEAAPSAAGAAVGGGSILQRYA